MASVSIIIPAFNAAATLGATVASVVRQTHADWEAIIYDDGSTDSTAANAQAWCDRDSRIRWMKGKARGTGGARNEAAGHATSPWLVFLDADDLIAPTYLATMLGATATPDPRPDLVYCAGAKIAADGRVGDPETPPGDDYFRLLASRNLFYVHACLVRRSTFEKFGGFDPALKTCEEWDLWQRFARAGAVFAGIDDSLALYRLRPASLSHKAELLFESARQVIARGHSRDPRVRDPLPAFAEGQPSPDAAEAIVAFATWCAGILIGSGKDPEPFLRRIEFPPTGDLGIDRCVSMMQGSVPQGACVLYEDWPALWPIHEGSIDAAFATVGQRCEIADFAARCVKEFKARLQSFAGWRERGADAKSAPAMGNAAASQSPILLMYHRINRIKCDPWALCVTPERFSEQLAVLKQERDVVPLSWLAGELNRGKVPDRTAILTFDDGYADALVNAKPLLQKHGCPATFFLATGPIGDRKGFWWDILARIILETAPLPDDLTLDIRGAAYSWRLVPAPREDAARPSGDVTASELYFALWTLLKPLRPDERESMISLVAAWAGTHVDAQERDRILVPEEVRRLSEPGFIDIGAHTVTHPSLPSLNAAQQRREIEESRTVCEELTGSSIPGFAYPFGDFNDISRSAVSAAGFQFACTTAHEPILPSQDLLRLPRVFVGDWDAAEFDTKILRES